MANKLTSGSKSMLIVQLACCFECTTKHFPPGVQTKSRIKQEVLWDCNKRWEIALEMSVQVHKYHQKPRTKLVEN